MIIGYDPSGSSFKRVVNFPAGKTQSAFTVPVVLNWPNISKVEIQYWVQPDGGGRDLCGGTANIVFNK